MRKRRNRLYITDIKVGDTVITKKDIPFSNGPASEIYIAISEGKFCKVIQIKKMNYNTSGYYYNIILQPFGEDKMLMAWKTIRDKIIVKNK